MTGKKWTLYKTLYLPQFIPPLIEVEIFCSCKVRKILYFQSQYCCHKLSNLKIKRPGSLRVFFNFGILPIIL